MPFHFQARKVHLTYKNHLPMLTLMSHLKDIGGEFKLYSIVHEIGEEDEDTPTPYEHTHVFIWWKNKFQSKNARVFDYNGIHPNIQTQKSIKWAKTICMDYHKGRKTKADGKKYFKEPVDIKQEGIDDWKFEEDQFKVAQAAPSLVEACLAVGVEIKSVSDVNMVRNAKRKRGLAEVEDDCDKAWIPAPDNWDRKKKSLIVSGPPGIGKTNWAIAQFKKPYKITDHEDLKDIPEDTDGLVFDDQEYARYKMTMQKMIADVRTDSTVRCRHFNAFKPKLPAIFTTNTVSNLFDMEADGGALKARAMLWEVEGMMYQ